MNKKKLNLLFLFCLITLIFLGCNQTTISVTPAQSTTMSVPRLTLTPSPIRSPSQTTSPAPTITPTPIPSHLPTITYTPPPTYTATFDAAHASTATLAPAADCPQENTGLVPNFVLPTPTDVVYGISDSKDSILSYLNAGASLDALMQYLIQNYGYYQNHPDYGTNIYAMDFTNDGVPELLVNDGNVRIYSCRDSLYSVIFEIPYQTFEHYQIEKVQDLNLDGRPEIFLTNWDVVAIDGDLTYQILGWHDRQIESLLGEDASCSNNYAFSGPCFEDGWIRVFCCAGGLEPWLIQDIDQNGTFELIIHDDVGFNNDAQYNGPWRTKTTIFMWNGEQFSLFTHFLEPPTYRFQAVQDADFAVLQGKFDEAFALYQQVIFNDRLEWWTKARQTYDLDIAYSNYTPDLPTSTPPAPDPDEYGHLAAYAYYRMMILQVKLGDFGTAQATYDSLQENFPTGIAGNIYTELASTFWKEYQTSLNISLACDSAIAFAAEHEEEVLFYIGSYIHGYQSLLYKPQDVCPFK